MNPNPHTDDGEEQEQEQYPTRPHGSVDVDEVDGFTYETGREIDENGDPTGAMPDMRAVVPGDVVETEIDGQFGFHRVVEVGRDGVLCFNSNTFGPTVVSWSSIVSKWDGADYDAFQHDQLLEEIEMKTES